MKFALAIAAALMISTPTLAKSIKRSDLIGTWEYVETYNLMPDGSKLRLFGMKPRGVFEIRKSGRYSHIIMHENPKAEQPPLVHYGTFTVNQSEGTFTGSIEGTSYPELDDKDQVRIVTKLTRRELHYINTLSVAGGKAKVVARLRRLP